MGKISNNQANGFRLHIWCFLGVLVPSILICQGTLSAQIFPDFPRIPLAQESGNNLHPDFTESELYGRGYADAPIGFAWDFGNDSIRTVAAKFWSAGDTTWSSKIVISQDLCINQEPDIEFFGDSTLVVWSSNKRGVFDIMYSIYDGIRWSRPNFLTQDSIDNQHPVLHSYRVGLDGPSRTLLLWERANTIYWSLFTGENWSTPEIFDTVSDSASLPKFSRKQNYPFVAWEGLRNNNWDIYCRYFHPDSNLWGETFRVTNDEAEDRHPSIGNSYISYHPIPDEIWGDANIAWQSNREGHWGIFEREVFIDDTLTLSKDFYNISRGASNERKPILQLISGGDYFFLVALYQSDSLGHESVWISTVPPYQEKIAIDTTLSRSPQIATFVVENGRIHNWIAWEHYGTSGTWEIWATDLISFMGGVEPESALLPKSITLAQNYPNPFNATTVIPITLARNVDITVSVYNLRGQLVKTLHNGEMDAGEHTLRWNGTNNHGISCQSGIYFIRVQSDYERNVQKAILLK